KSGLFVVLAREAADSAAEIARRQPKPPPPPKEFVPEPEHSTSPWANIRRELKPQLELLEYECLLGTRHGKLSGDQLLVLVAAEPHFYEDCFKKRILSCAAAAG